MTDSTSEILQRHRFTVADYHRMSDLQLLPEVWIIDLAGGKIEVYTNPSGKRFLSAATCRRGEAILSEAVSGISVDAVLG